MSLFRKLLIFFIIFSSIEFTTSEIFKIPVSATREVCVEKNLRIVLSWDDPDAVMVMNIHDPEGNHASSQIQDGIPGGQIVYEGSGLETFTMPEPIVGTYTIGIDYLYYIALEVVPIRVTVDIFWEDELQLSESHSFNGMGESWDAPEFTVCGKPIIIDVSSKYELDNTRFLEGIPVENPILVNVNWPGNSPGHVEFKLNGQIVGLAADTHILNMGDDLQNGLNRLEIIAQADGENAQRSESEIFQFYSIPQPQWMLGLLDLNLMSLPAMASVSYETDFQLPNKPFEIDASGFGPPGGSVKFDWEIGGELTIPLDCSTVPAVSLSAKGGLEFLNSNINLTGYGGIESERKPLCGFQPPNGFAGAKLDYSGTVYSKPLLIVVSYFNVALGQAVDRIVVVFDMEEFVYKLGEFYIDGNVEIDAKIQDIRFLENRSNPLVFENLNLTGELDIQGGFRSDLVIVEIDVYAGASGTVAFLRDGEISLPITDDWNFDKITLKGTAGAKFRAFWFTREAKGEIVWVYPPTVQSTRLIDQLEVSEWQLIEYMPSGTSRSLQIEPSVGQIFSQFDPNRSASISVNSTTVTETLINDIYPYPELSMAINPNNDSTMLTWVNTDPTKPIEQAHEIYFSLWDGTAWSQPTTIVADNKLDDAPQVAWASDNQAVALWHRMNTDLSPDASLTVTNTKQIEIVTATYSPTIESWSDVALLTDNNALDMLPHLARNESGDILATWRRNDTGQLVGDVTDPDEIIVAFYQQSWQPEMTAIRNIPGLIDLAVGYDNQSATIAYSYNLAPTGQITPTAQLFFSSWNGTDWSNPVQLTDDNRGNRNPQILYNAADEPLLIWLAEDNLQVRNLTTNNEQTLILPSDLNGIDEFHALQDSSGNIVATFVNKNIPRDIYLSYYDEEYSVWSNPKAITENVASERYLAPVFDSLGNLRMAYAKTDINFVEQTLDGETYLIPQEQQTSLVTLAHAFSSNLTLSDTDFVSSEENPPVDSTIILTATVNNSGDRAIEGITINFYDEDPSLRATPFKSIALSDVLPGNSSKVITTTFKVPSSVNNLYAHVEPVGQTVESNDLDNQAQLILVGPDLDIVSTQIRYWGGTNADLTTTINNRGSKDISSTSLVYKNDTDDAVLLNTTIPDLNAGGTVTLTSYLDLSTFQPGQYTIIAEAKPEGTTEFDSTNNSNQFVLQILPDIQISPQTIVHSPFDETTIHITSTIANIGPGPSTEITVGLYRDDIFNNASQLYTQKIPILAPNGSVTVAVQVPGPVCNLYVVVDQEGELDELTKSNNIVTVGTPSSPCVDFWFESNSNASSLPYTVQFFDMSVGNINSWLWDFGDGTTSTEKNPEHIYMTPGTYDISLKITGADGEDRLVRSNLITVNGLLAPNTPVPPTATATDTPISPTATATATSTLVVPTETATATNTLIPPIETSIVTSTPIPPTAIPPTAIPSTATAMATNTPVPPTAIPSTATAMATDTPVPPTATATVTSTPVPPTATATVTSTPVPPTATATDTSVPPTETVTSTPVPPTATATVTDTPVPPTETTMVTSTLVPPTATATATDTPVPPTETATATNTPVVGGADIDIDPNIIAADIDPNNDEIFNPEDIFIDSIEPTRIASEGISPDGNLEFSIRNPVNNVEQGNITTFIMGGNNTGPTTLYGVVISFVIPELSAFSIPTSIFPLIGRGEQIISANRGIEWELTDGNGPCPDLASAGTRCIFRVGTLNPNDTIQLNVSLKIAEDIPSDATITLDGEIGAANLLDAIVYNINDSEVIRPTPAVLDATMQLYLPIIQQ